MRSKRIPEKGDKAPTAAAALVQEIREIVRSARAKAFQAVNFAMVEAYWLIGKRIVQEEQKGRVRAEYGQQLIRVVSRQLTSEFGRGFSEANVWNFRQFYLVHPSEKILYALRRELSWTHNLLILGKCKRDEEQEFYLRVCRRERWSSRERSPERSSGGRF